MNASVATAAACLIIGATVASVSGCSKPSSETAPAVDTATAKPNSPQTIQPIALPDLSRVSTSVREQLQERFALLHPKAVDASATPVDRGAAFGELGKLFLAADYVDHAETCFSNAHALVPNEMRWPYYLGHLHRNQGDLQNGAAFFELARQLDPTNLTILVRLGELYLDQGKLDAAEARFQEAIALQPDSGAASYGLGRTALARNDDTRAVRYLEQALATNPRATRIHHPLALAYRRLGKLDLAQSHFQAQGTGEVHPPDPLVEELGSVLESAMAYQSRGILALERGDWQLATKYFQRGLELEPGSASMHHRLGTALYLAGDIGAATQQFQQALRVAPTLARAHYSLGLIAASNGTYAQAIDRFSKAVTYEPDYLEARLALADTLRGTGRLLDALGHYEQISSVDSRSSDATLGQAITLIRLKRYAAAREHLLEGTMRFPGYTPFSLALTRVLAAAPDADVRDGQRAMQELAKLANEPRSIELTETAAMVLAELGRFGEAASRQKEAIDAARGAGEHELARRMSENLGLYESGRPCRTPWREGELQ
jgi:tetratricopeptide (TPR) repeat protein